MFIVVRKAEAEKNKKVFSFRVGGERSRVSHGSLIRDYAVWLGFSFYNTYALQSRETSLEV